MARTFDVAVLVGSLRKASFTRMMAKALIGAAPETLRCRIVELGDLPMYNEDLDAEPPPGWTRLRREIAGADALLFLTPEYNRSIPGCLKNALDVGSRPQGKSVWSGKPAGIVSVTPYKLGAFGANHALRQAVVFLDVPVMQQPEAYIGNAAELFDEKGALKSEETRKFLGQFMTAFEQWVASLGRRSGGSFEAFMHQREKAAAAYVSGDATPLDALVARDGRATFFPPSGGSVSGAKEVAARYDKDATTFSPGGESHFEVLQSGTGGTIAFWTGFQDATAQVAGREASMKLRITEVFSFTGGEWKLVHRHADQATEAAARKA